MAIGNFLNIIRGNRKVKFFDFNIIISVDTNSFSLRAELGKLGWNYTESVSGNVIINSNVTVGGSKLYPESFSTSGVPKRSIINIINNGSIIGRGGDTVQNGDQKNGCTAIYLSEATHNLLNNGLIAGGGGAGGWFKAPGGGGAGVPAGKGASPSNPVTVYQPSKYVTHSVNSTSSEDGTRTLGGAGATLSSPTAPSVGTGTPSILDGRGGRGGDLGENGRSSENWEGWTYSGGTAGKAIRKENSSTIINIDSNSTGTILGLISI